MSDSSTTYTTRLSFGRLGQIETRLEPILAVIALAALVFVPTIGTLGALIFLAGGVVLCGLRPGEIFAQGLRHWPVLLLPIFCILSFVWSREPLLSMRFGVQLLATVVVTIAICRHLSPRHFLLTLFACMLVAMLASLIGGDVRGDTGARIGIYGSKNAFAGAASTFTVLAFGVALMRGAARPLRVLGLLCFAIGTVLVISAQSVSAILFLLPTLLALFAAMNVRRLGALPAWSILAFGGLGLILVGLMVQANWHFISAFVLDATGKDLTLTGRTELWASALALIEQRPLLGVGYQAFWVEGHADAELLWYAFGIESRSGFNFHNMFLSNAVEIGLFGAVLQTGLLLITAFYTGLWAIRSGRSVGATLFALCFVAVLGSVVEVPLFFQFSLRTVLVLAALIYARDAVHPRHARTVWRGA
ncbi:MAG: O-antigen ligase family protein [Pseudomonadota bacterium]